MGATTNLDRYQYISSLGSGGMATVELAEDTVLGRQVALKRMKTTGDTRGLSRLRREALIGASVSHPNLVSIYDVVSTPEGDQVIVMEYVPGETLRDLLFRETRIAPADALPILRGVGAALDAIHRQGIVHRDVKPANILLGRDGTVKLADLGVAAAPDGTRITTAGGVVGTYSYMAPEQLEGAPATAAVDIYALAAVAYEALSGRKAHAETNPVALAHAISTQPPPDLRRAWPEAPGPAAELLIRAMAKEPERRPRSASGLIGRLNAALEPVTTAPHTIPRAAPAPAPAPAPVPPALTRDPARSRPGILAAGLVALAALAVALVVILSHGTATPHHAGTPAGSPAGLPPAARARTTATGGARATSTSTSHGATTPATAAATSSTTPAAPTPATTTPATTTPASSSNTSPVSAVESFYGLAASHRYAQAWALADPAFQSQLGGYASFQGQQSGDRSITFNSARVVSQSPTAATVAVQTTSARNDGTHQCAGTVDLARSDGSANWLLHQIHINCS